MQPQIDIINGVLKSVRVTGSLQFCLRTDTSWRTKPGDRLPNDRKPHVQLMCFHILVEGSCWLKSEHGSLNFGSGDVIAFPFGDGHDLGAGNGEAELAPLADLPPGPWQSPPVLDYGGGMPANRLVCGFLHCEALNYPPMRRCLPPIIHVKSRELPEGHWLRGAIEQLASEMECPRPGGLTILERLTETMLVELLRHQLLQADATAVGWLAALSDRSLARCMAAIHEEPSKDWQLEDLAKIAGLSRTVLSERFTGVLGVAPVRYLREWRLYIASVQLKSTTRAIADIAEEAGYGTEATFSRAFSRSFGTPPAAWRKQPVS